MKFHKRITALLAVLLAMGALPPAGGASPAPQPDVVIAQETGAHPLDSPTLAACPDGTLLLAFRRAGAAPAVLLAESGDGGHTWSEPRAVLSAGELENPRLLALSDGALLLTFSARLSAVPRAYLCESRDGGASWGTPREICAQPVAGCAVLAEDRLLVSAGAALLRGCRDRDTGSWSWTEAGALPPSSLASPDGAAVYALAQDGVLRESLDGGATWTPCGSQGQLRQPSLTAADQRIFCTWTSAQAPARVWSKRFSPPLGWTATAARGLAWGLESPVSAQAGQALLTVCLDAAGNRIVGLFSALEDPSPSRRLLQEFEALPADESRHAAEQDGHLELFSRFNGNYRPAQLTSADPISGDYTAQFRFRFSQEAPVGGLQELQINLQAGQGTYVLHLRQDGLLFKTADGVIRESLPRRFAPGRWYTLKLLRQGHQISAKTWEEEEPAFWDLSYAHRDIGRTGYLRLRYLTSSPSGQTLELDRPALFTSSPQ